MIQDSGRNSFRQFNINLHAVPISCPHKKLLFVEEFKAALVIRGHYLTQFFLGKPMISHQIVYIPISMLQKGIRFVMP